MSVSGGPDWTLRAALFVALVALLVTALIVTVTRSPTGALTTAAQGGHPGPAGADTPATTTVPTTVAGTNATSQVGPACGFSLVAPGSRAGVVPARSNISAVGQCTVVEIGDSLGNDLGWGLARQVVPTSGLNLIQLDTSATGLANSSFYDWPAQLAVDLRQYHPQLVLVCVGGDDEQGMKVDGASVQFPTPSWQTAYLARVRQVISEATASGAYVLWIGMPIMQQPSYSQGMQILNALYQEGVTSEANATFVSTWSLFSNPRGVFQSDAVVNGAWTALRQSDGIHYSLAGEDVLATYVLGKMASIYHVLLAPADPSVINSWSQTGTTASKAN
jgi:hypothetical protein